MYSFKEKKKHFNALLNPDAAKYDLELLVQKQPNLLLIPTYSRNPKRYANDILYVLLDNFTREEIREFRRTKMNSEAGSSSTVAETLVPNASDVPQSGEDGLQRQLEEAIERAEEAEASNSEAGSSSTVAETLVPNASDVPQSGEDGLQRQLEEAIERAEEAEASNEEAGEAIAEAEARAEIAEAALEEEKKKEKSQAPVKSKSKKNTRKSIGTTSSIRKSK